MPLAWIGRAHGCDEGAILATAGLTFEAQRARERYRADMAFAAPESMLVEDLDLAVLACFERGR